MALTRLQQLCSAANLQRRCGGRLGQVSTFMLLMIAGALVMTLATANMGKMAVNATTASNAADSAALFLASQLSTKSYQLWDSLKGAPDDNEGRFKKCKSGGLLGIILAIVVAIIAIIIVVVTWGGGTPIAVAMTGAAAGSMTVAVTATLIMMTVGALGGMIGGAIGGGIAGGMDGALAGALQGMQLGMALGGLAAAATVAAPAAAGSAGNAAATGAQAANAGTQAAQAGGAMAKIKQAIGAVMKAVRAVMNAVNSVINSVVNTIKSVLGLSQAATGVTQAGTSAAQAGQAVEGAAGLSSSITGAAGTGTELIAVGNVTGQMGTAAQLSQGAGTAVKLMAGQPMTLAAGQTLTLTSGMVSAPLMTIPTAGTFAALTAASAIYNGYVADQITADAMAEISKATAGLRERHRIREGVFYTALTQSVTDPNMTRSPQYPDAVCHWQNEHIIHGDPDDIDMDGDTRESIPCFQYFWFQRIKMFKEEDLARTGLADEVDDFLKLVSRFDYQMQARSDIKCANLVYISPKHGSICRDGSVGTLLTREEIEGTAGGGRCGTASSGSSCGIFMTGCNPSGGRSCEGNQDGVLVKTARAFHRSGRLVDFWKPGPNLDEWKDWLRREEEGDCEEAEVSCDGTLPRGFDQVDSMLAEMLRFHNLSEELLAVEHKDDLVATVDDWFSWFYEPPSATPAENDSYYYTLNDYIDPISGEQIGFKVRLRAWQAELRRVARTLPACVIESRYDWATRRTITTATNPPCRTAGGFVAVDEEMSPAYQETHTEIDRLIREIDLFRQGLKKFYDNVDWSDAELDNRWGGFNPVTYLWKDSGGSHYIQAQTGPYEVPRLKSSSSLTKSCMKLRDYEDLQGARTWVRIVIGDRQEGDPLPEEPSQDWEWDPGPHVVRKQSRAAWGFYWDGSHDELTRNGMFVKLKSTVVSGGR